MLESQRTLLLQNNAHFLLLLLQLVTTETKVIIALSQVCGQDRTKLASDLLKTFQQQKKVPTLALCLARFIYSMHPGHCDGDRTTGDARMFVQAAARGMWFSKDRT